MFQAYSESGDSASLQTMVAFAEEDAERDAPDFHLHFRSELLDEATAHAVVERLVASLTQSCSLDLWLILSRLFCYCDGSDEMLDEFTDTESCHMLLLAAADRLQSSKSSSEWSLITEIVSGFVRESYDRQEIMLSILRTASESGHRNDQR